ncbi:MAG TPA: hypothetical protein VGI31_06590 [Streptosporangiaceae bacterium]|jgi:hypothetical protein
MWRRLPGGLGLKTAWLALIVLALAALLWFLVFPWATIHLPIDQA